MQRKIKCWICQRYIFSWVEETKILLILLFLTMILPRNFSLLQASLMSHEMWHHLGILWLFLDKCFWILSMIFIKINTWAILMEYSLILHITTQFSLRLVECKCWALPKTQNYHSTSCFYHDLHWKHCLVVLMPSLIIIRHQCRCFY